MFRIRLKTLRESKGMTQQEFANAFCVSKGTIGMWESGAREPKTLDELKRIADYFGVTTDYLLGQDEKKPTPVSEDGLDAEQAEIVRLYEAASPALRAAALAVLRSAEGQDKAPGGVSKAE